MLFVRILQKFDRLLLYVSVGCFIAAAAPLLMVLAMGTPYLFGVATSPGFHELLLDVALPITAPFVLIGALVRIPGRLVALAMMSPRIAGRIWPIIHRMPSWTKL